MIRRLSVQTLNLGRILPVLLIAVMAVTVTAADQQDVWLSKALVQNQEVIAARKKWQAVQEREAQARSFMDPMAGVEFMRMDSTRFDDYDMTEYMVSQQIPWFGKRHSRMDAARMKAEAEGFRYLETIRGVRARVAGAYWNLWSAHRAVEINRENRDLLTQFEVIARQRYEAGDGLQADVLKAQVELARLENELEILRSEYQVAQAMINRLLSEPDYGERDPPSDPATPTLRWTLDEAIHSARLYCCILMSFLLDAQAQEAELREARLEYAPDIEFRVAARQPRGQGGITEYDTGIAINIPWLWRGKYSARIREARSEVDMAYAEFQSELDMTLFEVRDAYLRAESSLRTIRLFEATVLPRSRELVDATRAAYESGQINFLDLIEAQKTLFDAQWAFDRARAAYGADLAMLEANIEPWMDYEIETGLVTEEMRAENER